LKKISTKIAAFILIAIFIACLCRKVPDGKQLHKNQITVNGKATKAENVFNQLYQNQIALYTRLSSAFELIQLSESESDSTQAKFTNHPGKYERKSKWLSAKQVDRLGKSFGIMVRFLKKQENLL
jgi:hypothetical protein